MTAFCMCMFPWCGQFPTRLMLQFDAVLHTSGALARMACWNVGTQIRYQPLWEPIKSTILRGEFTPNLCPRWTQYTMLSLVSIETPIMQILAWSWHLNLPRPTMRCWNFATWMKRSCKQDCHFQRSELSDMFISSVQQGSFRAGLA